MADDPELLRLLAFERQAVARRAQLQKREAARHRGVSWSGLSPDGLITPSPQDTAAAARSRLDRLTAWRASAAGRLLAATAAAQAAAERLRAAVSRGEPASGELQRQAAILADCAAQVVDAAGACGQSADACATNTASSSPSTGSPRSSAS